MRFKITKEDTKNLKSNTSLFALGVALLVTGLANTSEAQPTYNTEQLDITVCQILGLMEGSLGAFLTAVAGAGAIVASAFGAYRAGFSLIVVATSSFIIHSLVSLWFANYNCIATPGYVPPPVGGSSSGSSSGGTDFEPGGSPDPGEFVPVCVGGLCLPGGSGGGDSGGDSSRGDSSGGDSTGDSSPCNGENC